MTLHLAPCYIKLIQNILNQQIPHRKVIVFGSRITDHFKPHSDLDLCIKGDNPVSLNTMAALREAFSDSDLPMRVDIIDWASISPEFKKIIEANYMALPEEPTISI